MTHPELLLRLLPSAVSTHDEVLIEGIWTQLEKTNWQDHVKNIPCEKTRLEHAITILHVLATLKHVENKLDIAGFLLGLLTSTPIHDEKDRSKLFALLNHCSMFYVQKKMFYEAIDTLRHANELFREHPAALPCSPAEMCTKLMQVTNLAYIHYAKSGNSQELERITEKFDPIFPFMHRNEHRMIRSILTKKWDEALTHFLLWREDNQGEIEDFFWPFLYTLFSEIDDLQSLFYLCNEQLFLGHSTWSVYCTRAKYYFYSKQYPPCIADMEHAFKLNPELKVR